MRYNLMQSDEALILRKIHCWKPDKQSCQKTFVMNQDGINPGVSHPAPGGSTSCKAWLNLPQHNFLKASCDPEALD